MRAFRLRQLGAVLVSPFVWAACSGGDSGEGNSQASASEAVGRLIPAQQGLSTSGVKELLPQGGQRVPRTAAQIAAGAAVGFDYPATRVGTSGNVTVYYDSALGNQGLSLAQQLLSSVSGPYNDMSAFFGIPGGNVNVIVAPLGTNNTGSGGAYHAGCDFTSGGDLYLDATFNSTTVDPLDLEVGLYVAELSESFMGAAGAGWACGSSNGEGLSRFCAELETPPGTLDAFATASAWASAGFPDWVTKTEATDRDSVSTGAAVLYLYWMTTLGYTVPHITQTGGGTLAANYQGLTGATTAYVDLKAAAQAVTVNADNPFAHLWHSTRSTDGTWSGLGDVQSVISMPGLVRIVTAAAGLGGNVQYAFTTNDGHLWHTIRNADGSWSALGDVQSVVSIPGPVKAIASAPGAHGDVQYMLTTSGHVWHMIRYGDGSWSGLGDVQGVVSIPGSVKAVAAAASGSQGDVQFALTTSDGHLWHTIRYADGSWAALGDVQGVVSIPGPVEALTAAPGAGGDVQFALTTSDGHLWHTIRHADGSWAALGDVQGVVPISGAVKALGAAAGLNGDVDYMFTTGDGHLWHTIRYGDGSWAGLGDVAGQFAIPGAVRTVAGSATTNGDTQYMFAR